ncbi:MAG: zinc-ribbon domain-containing protein [Myxococcaceae bacterium]
MIVKCGNCQTRFKIPDDKVTDKGVKVRCTKCQNTFRVTKADAQPANAPAAGAPEADPFAKFGPTPDAIHGQETRPFQLPPDLLASQPKQTAAPAGPQGSPLHPSFAAQADVPKEMFDQPTRIGPPPSRPPPPASPPKTQPSAFDPFDFAGAPAKAPAASADPFSFGGEPATAPATAADPFDFGGQPTRVNPAPNPAAAKADPFDFAGIPAAGPTSPGTGGIKFELDDAPTAAPTQPNGSRPAADPFNDAMTQPNGKRPENKPGAFADPFAQGGGPDPFAAAEETRTAVIGTPKGMLSDVPPADSSPSPMDMGDARAMFDMPEPKAAPPPEPQKDDFGPSVPLAQIKLNKVPASELANPSANAADEKPVPPQPGAARKLTGVVVNIAIAAALVCILGAVGLVYLNEGKLEAQSFQPARLKSMLAGSTSWSAGDLSNGLYDTKSGKPVFFVRGEVKNRGQKAGKVKVRAEIMDGSSLVRSAEVYAGTAPTPEELYGIGNASDVDALAGKLEKGAANVAPGNSAPFLITFYEYPPDLSGFRLKVSVIEAGAEQTAAR